MGPVFEIASLKSLFCLDRVLVGRCSSEGLGDSCSSPCQLRSACEQGAMDSGIHLSGLLSRHDDEATRTSTSEGLEEGEVEGETLLIVESEDQASVDLSHDQSGDSLNSDEGDVSWMEEQLSYFCDKCQKWIPASLLVPIAQQMARSSTRG